MIRQMTIYAIWLCIVLGSMTVTWVVLHVQPVEPNAFNAYERYMPGAEIDKLLKSGHCENRYDEGRYSSDGYIWCDVQDSLVRGIAVSLTSNDKVKGVYFFLNTCSVNAGDLTLWYDADVTAIRHGARLISWAGGRSITWYPKSGYWTPERCLWGVWFKDNWDKNV